MPSSTLRKTISRYYWLTKPGIIYGNLFAAVAAYIFGAHGIGDISVFLGLVVGTSLVIASGCVINNIYDKDIDVYMERTKKRSLVTKKISILAASVYAFVLGAAGFAALLVWTNWQTVVCGAVGLVFYVPVYTIAKRKTVHGTLIGTISGATPPVAGYVAATGAFDVTALLLFLALVSWQMVHFYAIAVRRLDDYKSAKVPVLPVVKGFNATKRQIVVYELLFISVCVALATIGSAGFMFGLMMLLIGIYWLTIIVTKTNSMNQTMWAKRVFLMSLVVLVVFNIVLALSQL